MIERLFKPKNKTVVSKEVSQTLPTTTLSDPDEWLVDLFHHDYLAENISAVQRCLAVRANTISKLPLQVFKRTKDGRERITKQSVVSLLETRPNANTTPSQLKKLISYDIDCWGNAYILIEGVRDGLRRLEPWCVQVKVNDQKRLSYEYTDNVTGERHVYQDLEIMHFRDLGASSYIGQSKLAKARPLLENEDAAHNLESKYYKYGTIAKGMLVSPNDLNQQTKAKIREEWEKVNAGMDNAFRVPILDRQLDYKEISMSFADAQFLAMRKYSVIEIARFFNVPAHKLWEMEGAKFNNIEQQNQDFIENEIQPLLTDIEEEIDHKYFFESEKSRGYFCRFNMEAALRADSSGRSAYYEKMLNLGALNINEIRKKEDLSSIGEDGEIYWGNLNRVPLEIMKDYQLAKAGEGGSNEDSNFSPDTDGQGEDTQPDQG